MAGTVGYVHVSIDRVYRDVIRSGPGDEAPHHSSSSRVDHNDLGRTYTSYIDVSAAPGLNSQRIKAADLSRQIQAPVWTTQVALV